MKIWAILLHPSLSRFMKQERGQTDLLVKLAVFTIVLVSAQSSALASTSRGYFQYRAYDSFWDPESVKGPDLFWHSSYPLPQNETLKNVAPIQRRVHGNKSTVFIVHTESEDSKHHLRLAVTDTTGNDYYDSSKNRLDSGFTSLPSGVHLELPAGFRPTHQVQIPRPMYGAGARVSFSDYSSEVLLYDSISGIIRNYGASLSHQGAHRLENRPAGPTLPTGLTTITPLWINDAPAYVLYRAPSGATKGMMRVVQLVTADKTSQWTTLWEPPAVTSTECVQLFSYRDPRWRNAIPFSPPVPRQFKNYYGFNRSPSRNPFSYARKTPVVSIGSNRWKSICPPGTFQRTLTTRQAGEVDESWTHVIPMAHPFASQHLLAYNGNGGEQGGQVAMYEVSSDGALALRDVAAFESGFENISYMDYLSDWSSYVLFYDKDTGNTQVASINYLDDEILVREDVALNPGLETITSFLRGFVSFANDVQTHPDAVCNGAPAIEETLDTFPVAQSDINKYNNHFDLDETDWNEGFGYKTFYTKPWRPYARTIRGLYILDKLSNLGVPGLDKYNWVLEWLDYLAPVCQSGHAIASTSPYWGTEKIELHHNFFYHMYPVERAAVIVHEAAHVHDMAGHVDCALGQNACDQRYGGSDPGALTVHVDYLAELYNLRSHNHPSSEIELTTLMYRRIKSHHESIWGRFVDNNPPQLNTSNSIDTSWE